MADTDLNSRIAKIKDELREAQNGISQMRESVVVAVMRRNKLSEDMARQERQITDLETKAALAERISNAPLAAELRTERGGQEAELERTRALFAEAERDSETAKRRLPEEELQMRQRSTELQVQLGSLENERLTANASNGFSNNPDLLFQQAADKIHNLTAEAAARSEVAGNGNHTLDAPITVAVQEPSADKMLRELEARYSSPTETVSAPAFNPVDSSRYLEFDTAEEPAAEQPAESESAVTAPQSFSPAAMQTASIIMPLPPVVPALPAGFIAESAAPASPSPEPTIEMLPAAEDIPLPAPEIETPAEIPVPETVSTSKSEETALDREAEIQPEIEIEPQPETKIETEPAFLSELTESETEEPEFSAAEFNIIARPKRSAFPAEETGRIRVAAIGTGGIFRGAHLPAYADIPQMQLVAICDPDRAAQDLAYQKYLALLEVKIKLANAAGDIALAERLERDLETVQICDDISEVIETVKPDVADICTQPFLHAPLAIQALDAGIHVMCEKPISRSWLESQRVIAAVERSGKLYQHNENWLWDKDYYTAKKLIDSGAIGEPLLMFLATAHGGPEGNPKFWNPDFGGGGALLDNGIHAIGAAWFMSGLDKQPTLVKSAEPFGMSMRMPERILDGRYQKIRVEDDAHILIRFENADSMAWTSAHIEGSWSHRDSPDTAIIGSTGKIVFHDEGGHRYALIMDAYDRESRRIEVSGPNWSHWPSSYYGEILNFIESVKHNTPSISDAKFGAECSAIVGASYLSEQRGRKAVHIDEFKQFANDIAAKYPNDPTGADNALVDALLSAIREG